MPRKGSHKLKKHNRVKPNPVLEKIVLFVAVTEPLMTMPQILQIYGSHNTGVSVTTWAMYLGASIIWLIYGIKTRNKPIIITDLLWIIVEVAVIVGATTR
jgi:uncharacterized protein with PQ loop repeat